MTRPDETEQGGRRDAEALVEALVERLVRESGLPDRLARDDLRRELESHFAEAGDSPAELRAAIERFGSADAVRDGFRRAYRRGRLAMYAAKVVASVVVATVAALLLQAAVFGVHLGEGADARDLLWHLWPATSRGARASVAVVLALVAAWELGVEPLCARLERRPARLLATLGAIFALISTFHFMTDALIAPERALVASALLTAVWACTIAILARLDLAYVRWLGPDA